MTLQFILTKSFVFKTQILTKMLEISLEVDFYSILFICPFNIKNLISLNNKFKISFLSLNWPCSKFFVVYENFLLIFCENDEVNQKNIHKITKLLQIYEMGEYFSHNKVLYSNKTSAQKNIMTIINR